MAYPWPGNVRELEGTVQTTLALHKGSEPVSPEELLMPTWNDVAESHAHTPMTPEAVPSPPRLHAVPAATRGDLPQAATLSQAKQNALERFERQYLHQLLTATRGNVAEAARRAGTDRKTLWRMMRRHAIDAVEFKRRSAADS